LEQHAAEGKKTGARFARYHAQNRHNNFKENFLKGARKKEHGEAASQRNTDVRSFFPEKGKLFEKVGFMRDL